MRNLLQDADRDRLVAPLAGALLGRVALGGRPLRALAIEEGGAHFPAEANAQAAELLLMPGLREAHGALAEGLLDFVMAMAEAEPACRHAVAGRLDVLRDDPSDLDVANPFFRLTGDLTRGVLRQEPLPAGRPALCHTGNLVEFRIGRHRACVDVEECIVEAAVERQGEGVVLRHLSAIRGTAGLLVPRSVEAGTLEMRYAIMPDSPVLRLTARFTAARRLAALRLTTALDAVDAEGLGATAARLLAGGTWRDAAPPDRAGATRWAEGMPVAHLAAGQAGWPADAPAVHLRPLNPGQVFSVTAAARQPGALHWLLLRHGPARLGPGESLVVVEERLLAPGGAVEAVASRMAAGLPGLDLAPAPPSGAALNAVATALLCEPPGARAAALGAFADRQAARIEAASPGAVELGWAAVAVDSLRRARGARDEALRSRLVARVVALVDANSGLVGGPGEDASLAAQALAVLALARAATWREDAAVLGPLARALAAVAAGEAAERPAILLGGRPVDPAAEVAGVALLCRAAGAVVLAAEAGAALPGPVLDQARALHRVAVNLLRPLVRPRDGALHVLARGALSPGPQALVTLALLAPDRVALGAVAA